MPKSHQLSTSSKFLWDQLIDKTIDNCSIIYSKNLYLNLIQEIIHITNVHQHDRRPINIYLVHSLSYKMKYTTFYNHYCTKKVFWLEGTLWLWQCQPNSIIEALNRSKTITFIYQTYFSTKHDQIDGSNSNSWYQFCDQIAFVYSL